MSALLVILIIGRHLLFTEREPNSEADSTVQMLIGSKKFSEGWFFSFHKESASRDRGSDRFY
jgi:hypothetical protein